MEIFNRRSGLYLISAFKDNDVVTAVVGSSVLDLDGGSLLDPLLSGLVGNELLGVEGSFDCCQEKNNTTG